MVNFGSPIKAEYMSIRDMEDEKRKDEYQLASRFRSQLVSEERNRNGDFSYSPPKPPY